MIYARLTGGCPSPGDLEEPLALSEPRLAPIMWVTSSIHPTPPLVPNVCQPLLNDAEASGRPSLKEPLPWTGGTEPCRGWRGGSFLAQPPPSSALVLAFRGAHRKQEGQRRKLEQQMALMEARQAEELALLEATVRALGRPRPPCPPPGPGETFL